MTRWICTVCTRLPPSEPKSCTHLSDVPLFAEEMLLWGGGWEWFHHYYLFHYCAPLSVGDNSWKETSVFASVFPLFEPPGTTLSAICEFCVGEHSEGWDQAEAVGSFLEWQSRCVNEVLFPCLSLWLKRDLFYWTTQRTHAVWTCCHFLVK